MIATAIGFGMKTLIQISAVVCTAGLAHGQSPCSYTVQIMPEMDCGSFQGPIPPVAINNSGVVILVGDDCGDGDARSFWWQEGLKELQPIPLPLGIVALRANDISDAGLVVGEMGGSIGQFGFIFDIKTQQFIAQIPAPEPGGDCALTGINQTGFACGWRKLSGGGPVTARTTFLYEIAIGQLTDLGFMNGESASPTDISDNNAMTGVVWINGIMQGFLYDSGKIVDLGTLANDETVAWGINNKNQIVGRSAYKSPKYPYFPSYPFMWVDGKMSNLGLLPGHNSGTGLDVSDSGLVVGTSAFVASSSSESVFRGVLWYEGQVYILSDLLDQPGIWTIEGAGPLNSNGQILATAISPQFDVASVVLTPNFPLGDITANCAVDVDDLLRVINEWGDSNSTADLDESGIVDVSDLMIVIENWSVI